MSKSPDAMRLYCPFCGKLLAVAHLAPGSWVENLCKCCKRKITTAVTDNGELEVRAVNRT